MPRHRSMAPSVTGKTQAVHQDRSVPTQGRQNPDQGWRGLAHFWSLHLCDSSFIKLGTHLEHFPHWSPFSAFCVWTLYSEESPPFEHCPVVTSTVPSRSITHSPMQSTFDPLHSPLVCPTSCLLQSFQFIIQFWSISRVSHVLLPWPASSSFVVPM